MHNPNPNMTFQRKGEFKLKLGIELLGFLELGPIEELIRLLPRANWSR